MKTGLVLEGGGMRGLYTAGILDLFLKENIDFDYIIGVSAGACNAASYISRQLERNQRIFLNFIGDRRYLSLYNFLKTGSLFGMDFIFDEIPNKLDLFDYDAFKKSTVDFLTGVTDIMTGKTVYFNKEKMCGNFMILRASSSIPVFSPIVEFEGGKYLDGGTSDPIPVKKAVDDGCEKLVIVLTHNRGYKKSPERFKNIYRKIYKSYPEMINVLDKRHEVYNQTIDFIEKLESEGKALVLAPKRPFSVGRFEKKPSKLKDLYQQGFEETKEISEDIKSFLI
ncbi:NTE family protein RssA [Oxobacter pfennigii]|uniref:NTE family protein RssA n=1 Tax=Oxobacter pfennigii TaxID=36849 RepID=A0A0P9ADD6_9CLOT|nr:patatin family protein [Oxobacter pfennigii]KPU43123.1 NTE family protein RssA [Oxobacter pfennigii]